ncbi:unnamed protein product [Sphagnum balticum]
MIAGVPPTIIYAQPILSALHNLLSTSIVNIIDPPTGSMMQQSLISIAGEQLITWTFGNLSSSLANDTYASSMSPAFAYNVSKSLLMIMTELGTVISVAYRNPLQCESRLLFGTGQGCVSKCRRLVAEELGEMLFIYRHNSSQRTDRLRMGPDGCTRRVPHSFSQCEERVQNSEHECSQHTHSDGHQCAVPETNDRRKYKCG